MRRSGKGKGRKFFLKKTWSPTETDTEFTEKSGRLSRPRSLQASQAYNSFRRGRQKGS